MDMEGNMTVTDEMIEAALDEWCKPALNKDAYRGDVTAMLVAAMSAIEPAGVGVETPPPSTHVAGDALRILQEGIDGAEADMQSDADAGERVDLFDYEISLPYETAREIATLLRAVPPIPNFAGILQRVADEIAALKLHPITSEEYDAGYIGGRGDAFAIVDEALDALLVEPKPEPLLSTAEQKEQAKRCSCHGSDDYCPCQNVPDATTQRLREAAQAAVDTGGLPIKEERELRAALATPSPQPRASAPASLKGDEQ